MARINIEDCLFSDPRFMDLIIRVGSYEMAVGSLVVAYKTAQSFWVPNKSPIPSDQFRLTRLRKEIIECGLAEVVDDGAIYVKGSEKYFAWLIQRSKAGRENKGKLGKRKRTKLNGTKRDESSYSYSSSYSSSNSDSDSIVSQGGADAPSPGTEKPVKNPLNGETWKAYAKAYYERYGTEPVRNATVNAQVAQIVKRLGEEAPHVVNYFVCQDGFYASRLHAISLCLKDAEVLRTQWATGISAPKATMNKNDELAENVKRQMEMINRGEL